MNSYQKLAFGVAGMFILALTIAFYDIDMLMLVAICFVVVAILTLKTTWKLILSIGQLLFAIIAGFGHVIGIVGDEVVDWCKDCKSKLGTPSVSTPSVPDWGSAELIHADGSHAPSGASGLSVLDEAMDRQNN